MKNTATPIRNIKANTETLNVLPSSSGGKYIKPIIGVLAVLFMTSLALTTHAYDDKTKQEIWIGRSKEGVKARLKDPKSAQFRNVFFTSSGGKPMVCGEVNSKNSLGGYAGYQRFVAAGESLAFLENEVQGFGAVWNRMCKR